jgi:hypothetical protein
MQIKYNINTPNFMIGEHAVCIFSNTNFGLKVDKWRLCAGSEEFSGFGIAV